MGLLNIRVGDVVPVRLKLANGVTAGVFPQVMIRDNNTNPTLDLAHVANGVWAPAAPYLMPSEAIVTLSYVVFTDAGHTTKSDVYEECMDVFRLNDPPSESEIVAMFAALNDITVPDVWQHIIDGTGANEVDAEEALREVLAVMSGDINKVAQAHTYQDRDGNNLLVLTVGPTSRVRS